MKAKYSPTVSVAYQKDQNWFEKYAGENPYDPDGYDPYGYDYKGLDRAGKTEYDYQQICECCGQKHDNLFWSIRDDWDFDSVKPFKIGKK